MPAPQKIKVIFKRVFVKNSADWFGSGEFYFDATVDGKKVGNKQIFDAREGKWIDLPPATWSKEVDVAGKSSVEVRFHGMDEDLFSDDDLGAITYTLRPDWKQENFRHDTEFFGLEWAVELQTDGKYGMHPPSEVFACRAVGGNAACTTVSGVPIVARIEIHPVRPVPSVLPPRGVPLPLLGVENKGGTMVKPTDPINIVPNPSVIPILSAPGTTLAAGDPPIADATNAARIEVTFYRPDTLKLETNGDELVWSVRPLSGGAAKFLGSDRGLKVLVYGTADGEVALDLKLRGELMATYRALVKKVKPVPCRVNILKGTKKTKNPALPRTTPANAQDHLAIANRFLRQVALELVLDTDPTVTDHAKPTAVPGVFEIDVTKGVTRGFDADVADPVPTRLNYRPDVMNFAYVYSDKDGNLGAATDFPDSKVKPKTKGKRPIVTDSGTPSSSWVPPSGVLPDGPAQTVEMTLIKAIQRKGHKRLFAMFVSDSNGDPSVLAFQQKYANTMSHEFCHILNLGHRVEGKQTKNPAKLVADGIFFDGLTHPPRENLMHWDAPMTEAQDLDILQARAVHESPLVK